MADGNISKIQLPNGNIYDIKDEKVKTVNISGTEQFLVFGARTGTETKMTSVALKYTEDSSIGTLIVGYPNTSGRVQGKIQLNGNSSFTTTIVSSNASAHRTITLPNASGTVALTSDIPTVPSWALASSKPTYTASEVGALPSTTTIPSITLNGSSTTSPSFYAPTTAGIDGYVLTSNGSGAPIWATVAAVGMIEMFAGSVAPNHWLLCDGSAVSRTTYSALFAVIGTTYGGGDGSTTFNLPDLVGRVPIGAGTGSAITSTQHTLGSTGGEETHTLTPEETALKGHTHSLSDHTHTLSSHTHTTTIGSHRHYPYSGSSYKFVQTTSGQTVNAGGISGSGTRVYIAAATSATTNWQSQTGSTDIGNKTSGGPSNNISGVPSDNTSGNVTETNGTAHNIMQPYLSINYIIYAGE